MSKTVLITGATGFIGSHVAEQLLRKGYTVRAFVRKSSSKENLSGVAVEYIEGDYKNLDSLKKAVSGVDYIYHIAGTTKAKTEQGYIEGNVLATENLLKATVEAAPKLTRFLHTSSQTATGPSTSLSQPVDESSPCHPITTYGRTKLMAEEVCRGFMDKLPITIVRPPAVYGEKDKDFFEFFKAYKNGLAVIVGFGVTQHLSLVHATDLAAGMILACESDNAVGQTYFIASEKFYTWDEIAAATRVALNQKFVFTLTVPPWGLSRIGEVAEFFARFSDKPALLNRDKVKDGLQNFWTCSIEKAKHDLGYKQTLSLEAGISQTITWYKANGWL
jgi:dihydroflavonol-4-reductase